VNANGHHFSPGELVVFRNVQTATFLNNQVVSVGTTSPTTFTAAFVHADYGPTADTGNAFQAIDASGALLAPNSDGVTTAAAPEGDPVPVGTSYGSEYAIVGAIGGPFPIGSLIYAGLNGTVTNDYTALLAQPGLGWILVVGRMVDDGSSPTTSSTMLWEPHVPTLYAA
jgi:hypothetical protein